MTAATRRALAALATLGDDEGLGPARTADGRIVWLTAADVRRAVLAGTLDPEGVSVGIAMARELGFTRLKASRFGWGG